MTRALLLIASMMLLATGPAAAQRFDGSDPVCLQTWEWGGSSTIACQYRSWEACKTAAIGLSATCLTNPYVQRPPEPRRRPSPR